MFFLMVILINFIYSNYLQSFNSVTLDSKASMIDITDYDDINPLILTNRKLYLGIPPEFQFEINSTILNISAAATYNKNIILLACSKNALLSQININSSKSIDLVSYDKFNLSLSNNNYTLNYSCSICISENKNQVFIGISQFFKNSLQNKLIKFDLNYTNEEFLINNTKIYSLDRQLLDIEVLIYPRQISCETIAPLNEDFGEPFLICGYINDKFQPMAMLMNQNFSNLENEITIIKNLNKLVSFKLQRINKFCIRYLITKNSYEISLEREQSKYKIKNITTANKKFGSFNSYGDLFYYNNNFLFISYPTDSNNIKHFYLFIKANFTSNYMRTYQKNQYVYKIIGFYNIIDDKFIFYFEYSNTIKYYTITNITFLYNFKCEPKNNEYYISESKINEYNVSKLVLYPNEFEKLSLFYVDIYYTTTSHTKLDTSLYNFNIYSQILTTNSSINDWKYFVFSYSSQDVNNLTPIFYLYGCTIFVKTCTFKCGSCSQNYSICDPNSCRQNFTQFKDMHDKDCYPNDQNFPGYIYNPETNYYENCFSSCMFCSFNETLNSNDTHNCLTCKVGYLRSYEYLGNCYKIDTPFNNSNYEKIVNNILDENYTTNSCINKYKINSTGECVTKCPNKTIYYNYKFDNKINFANQANSALGKQYTLIIEEPPIFSFNNICYSKCPSLTEKSNDNTCKCLYRWEQNLTSNEIICYNYSAHCPSEKYLYHIDSKECYLNETCQDEYYQFNFDCYRNCPDNSYQNSSSGKCESIFDYCYIDQNYETHCQNLTYEQYPLNYNNTKIYFKSCNDSEYFFNIITYLYKNICYQFCPEETINNNTDNRCSCRFYKYYLDQERNEYECLNISQSCKSINKYPIIEQKLCVDNLNECINANYKIFNEECLTNCPQFTILQSDNYTCFCTDFYYNQTNNITCFNPSENCSSLGYELTKYNAKECISSIVECINKGYKIFNNLCYEECPSNSEVKYNDSICLCSYKYYNQSNYLTCFDSNETCETRNKTFTNFDTNECFETKDDCVNKGYKIFNNFCYKECPSNTYIKNNDSMCYCSYYYFNQSNSLTCFDYNETCETRNLTFTNYYTNECFETQDFCINRGYNIFNNFCYEECPYNTQNKNNNNICQCSYNYFNQSNYIICFDSTETCESKNMSFTNNDTKECFETKDDCINRGYKIFNNFCYEECPFNTKEKYNDSICYCSYYYLNDSNNLTCFNFNEACESRNNMLTRYDTKECITKNNCINNGYKIFNNFCVDICLNDTRESGNSSICICENYFYNQNGTIICTDSGEMCINQTKECFYSEEDCINKGNKIFNKQCYLNCSSNSIDKLGNGYCSCEFYYFNDSNKFTCFEENKVCSSYGYLYVNKNTKECFNKSEDCILRGFKVFNYECYNECPKNSENKNGYCECSDYYYYNNDKLICFEKGKTCLSEGYINGNKEKECLINKEKCPKDFPYLIIENKTCVEFCSPLDFFNGACKSDNENINNGNNGTKQNSKDVLIDSIDESISKGEMNNLVNEVINGEKEYMVKNDDTYFQITTSEMQKKKNNNISSLNLGECEDILKKHYNISKDKPLLIFKIDYYQPGSKVPLIRYKIYHPDTKEKLNINVCKNANVELDIYIDIDDDIDKHDPNSDYFNDQCYPSTSDDGVDITLNDRKNEYNSNNMSLCSSECNFNGYDNDTKEVICICGISSQEFSISELSNKTDILFHNFSYSDGNSRIVTLKCFNTLFTKEGLAKNIGSYILLVFIFLFISSAAIFYKFGYPMLQNKIKEIISYKGKEKIKNKEKDIHRRETINIGIKDTSKKNDIIFSYKNRRNKKYKATSKKSKNNNVSSQLLKFVEDKKEIKTNKNDNKNKHKQKYHGKHITNEIRIDELNIHYYNNASSNKGKIKLVQKEKKENKNNSIYNKYMDFELNSFSYKEALKNDKRTLYEYYISLIKTKNPIIFLFCQMKDYNSFIIKLDLFLLSFSFYYFINALFFDESTIHKIYEDKGKYNILYLIPHISYSFIISHFISTVTKYIFLSERDIIKVKKKKTHSGSTFIIKKVKKRLVIKYICFYCIGLIFLVFFWYYLSTFGAVLQSTQIFLIKNTAICFSVSFFYPFFINIIPSIIRKCSLKDDKSKLLYKVNKFLQLI